MFLREPARLRFNQDDALRVIGWKNGHINPIGPIFIKIMFRGNRNFCANLLQVDLVSEHPEFTSDDDFTEYIEQRRKIEATGSYYYSANFV